MKKFLLLAALCAVVYFGLSAYNERHKDEPINQNHSSTLQARASHKLGIMRSRDVDPTDDPLGHCTGTVVGPHAILTAEHCNRGKTLELDYSLRPYHIIKILRDHRDHVIYLVDGPAFYEIEPYVARKAFVGEKAHIYGCGGTVYPCLLKLGVVTDEYDPSEVDQADGLIYSSIPGIPGDSGSAVYGEDGAIIAVLTYGGEVPVNIGVRRFIGAFALQFTPEQITEAQSFDLPKETHVNPAPRPKPIVPVVITVTN